MICSAVTSLSSEPHSKIKKEVTNMAIVEPKNLEIQVIGTKLIITIDLEKELETLKSNKLIIASSPQVKKSIPNNDTTNAKIKNKIFCKEKEFCFIREFDSQDELQQEIDWYWMNNIRVRCLHENNKHQLYVSR